MAPEYLRTRDDMLETLDLFDPTLDIEDARSLPEECYTDPRFLDLEMDAVFSKTWQPACRVDELKKHGDYVKVTIGRDPVIVIRGKDGQLRALSGVCRHRANDFVEQTRGTMKSLLCRYHGWNYDLTGKLKAAPDMRQADREFKNNHSLAQFGLETWGPYVWVNLDPSASPLQQSIRAVMQNAKDSGFQNLQWHARRTYTVPCNWKVFVDNYGDGGTHVKTTHRSLASALNDAEYRTDIDGNCSTQSSPIVSSGIADIRNGDKARYVLAHPNLMFNFYQGCADTNFVIPTGTDSCEVIFDFYFDDTWDTERREKSIRSADVTQKEDEDVSASVGRGVKSKRWPQGPFSWRETAAYHFQTWLVEQYRAELTKPSARRIPLKTLTA